MWLAAPMPLDRCSSRARRTPSTRSRRSSRRRATTWRCTAMRRTGCGSTSSSTPHAAGDVDRMFLSGGQIDAHGNTNVTAIGGMPNPKIKLGGGGGGANISATIGALTLWTTRHRSGRTLVPTLDFLTDLGHVTPSGTREQLGHTGGGPEWLVTELGVFDFVDGRARLVSRFPDVDLEDIRRATGFELDVAPEVGLVGGADGGRAGAGAGDRPARRTPVGVLRAGAGAQLRQPGVTGRPLLDALFAPRRVALVGASDRAGSLGALLAANLASFPGEVVHVRSGESLRDLAGPIDLAVVAVPAAAVPGVAADASAAGVTAMVVLSGGFAESGPEGALLQEQVLRAAAPEGGHRVRVIGPNCFGVQNCDLPAQRLDRTRYAAGRWRDLGGQPVRGLRHGRARPRARRARALRQGVRAGQHLRRHRRRAARLHSATTPPPARSACCWSRSPTAGPWSRPRSR